MRFLVDRPFSGVTFLFVLPVVLAAVWFGTPATLAVALAAAPGDDVRLLAARHRAAANWRAEEASVGCGSAG